MEIEHYIYLFIGGFIVGIINTLSGGGSLLSLPLLMFCGLPADIANGTNRLGVFIGSISASFGYVSKKEYPKYALIYLLSPSLLGAWFGTNLSLELDEEMLKKGISIVLILSFIHLLFFNNKNNVNKTKGHEIFQKQGHIWKKIALVIGFFLMGIYGGFIQAGVGFIIIGILAPFNFSINKINPVKVFIIGGYTVLSLIIFYINDKINWTSGIILSAGALISSWLVSIYSLNWNEKYINIFLMIVLVIFAIKLWI